MNEPSQDVSSTEEIQDLNQEYKELVLNNQESKTEANIEENKEEKKPSNGLENFAIEDEDPKLFDSVDDGSAQEFLPSDEDENKSEEDDLEIPAFLRRQKN